MFTSRSLAVKPLSTSFLIESKYCAMSSVTRTSLSSIVFPLFECRQSSPLSCIVMSAFSFLLALIITPFLKSNRCIPSPLMCSVAPNLQEKLSYLNKVNHLPHLFRWFSVCFLDCTIYFYSAIFYHLFFFILPLFYHYFQIPSNLNFY